MIGLLKLVLGHWKLAAAVAAAAVCLALLGALGVQTYRLRGVQADYEAFRLRVAAEGKAAKAEADAKDAQHARIKGELEDEIKRKGEQRQAERKARSDRFGSLYGKYLGLLNAGPGGGAVPEAGGGAAEPVLAGRVCFDRERFTAGIRRELGALYSELEPLARRGEDGLDDRSHWGQWARLVGACLTLSPTN